MSEYKKLKNGSDIRGIAIEGVAGEALKPHTTGKAALPLRRVLPRGCRKRPERIRSQLLSGGIRECPDRIFWLVFTGVLQRRRPGV